jgi:hypothetical protein
LNQKSKTWGCSLVLVPLSSMDLILGAAKKEKEKKVTG